MARLFVAIEIPAPVRKAIFKELIAPLEGLKPVKEENVHLTLCFVGEAQEKAAAKKLDEIEFAPFEIKIHGVSRFEENVVWLGANANEAGLLAQKICSALKVNPEKVYASHITLARGKEGADFFHEFAKVKNSGFHETLKVNKFALMKSELTKEGPVYTKVKEFTLEAK